MIRRPRFSVVVISRNEGAELRRTVENFDCTLPDGSEIVVVDDGSTDGSARRIERGRVRVLRTAGIGVARARNLGARKSRREIVVWADAHIRLDEFWWRPLAELLEDPSVGAAAPAVNHMRPGHANGYGLRFTGPALETSWLTRRRSAPFAAPILPGCCFAMRREVFEASGGWDTGMLRRGCVDNEGCVRFWLMGYELMMAPEVKVRHLFRDRSPYPMTWPELLHNRLRLAFVHLSAARVAKVTAALRNYTGFGEALLLMAEGNAAKSRSEWIERRARSDDWLFERFGYRW